MHARAVALHAAFRGDDHECIWAEMPILPLQPGGFGLSGVLLQSGVGAQTEARQGYVLEPTGGEHLVHFRDHGNIFIKINSDNFALGTQQVMAGSGIPIPRHFEMDEAFYVLDGSGIVTLNDVPHPFERGETILIPKNSWHGFRIRLTNCSCSGSFRLQAWRASSVRPAIRPACRPSGSLESSSMRSPGSMQRNSDNQPRGGWNRLGMMEGGGELRCAQAGLERMAVVIERPSSGSVQQNSSAHWPGRAASRSMHFAEAALCGRAGSGGSIAGRAGR